MGMDMATATVTTAAGMDMVVTDMAIMAAVSTAAGAAMVTGEREIKPDMTAAMLRV
jgi:hypothetical protein